MPATTVTAEDVRNASRGMLQKQLYVVFTTPTGTMEAVLANLEAHLAFQVDLEKRGIMVGAGPFWTDDEKEWRGEGMVIIRATSLAEARAIADTDPMHKSGARSYRVRPWLLNEGTLTLKVSFSDKAMVLE
jgi:uncharacterized protein